MEKDLKELFYRNPQVANAVNCFIDKLKLIEDKYPNDFSINKNIVLQFNDFVIKKDVIGDVPEPIISNINQSFTNCLLKYKVEEISISKPI